MLKITKAKGDKVHLISNEPFFEYHFTFQVLEDRIEFTKRTAMYDGKTRIMTKKVSKSNTRYFNIFDLNYPIGVYPCEIENDVLTIYKSDVIN